MTTSLFRKLFWWEMRQMPRRGFLWVVVAILFAAFAWGAVNAEALRRSQTASVAKNLAADAAWRADVDAKVRAYSTPSNVTIQYWQDPTDVDAFSHYFLRQSAAKPALPLAALSVGQSDLLPFFLPVKLDTPFGIDPSYDFEHPRALALGLFDMGFALVFFLPIGVILLVTMVGAYERDHGILRFAASQAVSPRLLLGTKLLALAAWLVPLLLIAATLALVVAGAPVLHDLVGLGAMLLAMSAYALFWFTLSWLVLSFQRGAAASASALIAIWALFAIVVPKAATLGTALFVPQNSYVDFINQRRVVEDAVMRGGEGWDGSVRQWLDGLSFPQAKTVDPTSLSYAAHLVFVAPERERRLRATADRMAAEHAAAGRWTLLVELLSPPAALQDALSTIAGTDARRHDRFLTSVREYQHELRDFVYPRVKAQVLNPAANSCSGCAGRLTFTEHHAVPSYRVPGQTTRQRIEPALAWAAFFCAISAVLGLAAVRRGRLWRPGELQ
ncbi:DUF3526 domain-containing protein [Novosphingobium sp. AP12]|uniref:DUF3526 domain-containing protein n=1 Tax=Novosphingobium sp. AP12 TaxID=1144305 RepID=UPI000271F1AB|nr:DUF3526 domain-containing protein [Novosphingobium sp. AP12]EJL24218.1 Protein of unknown function (DUF3526) [Novosphingobium sp. AP12]